MKLLPSLAALALLAYLATGFYIVGPDEQAVVRRFGRVDPRPRLPGLQYDLPWGLSRVDRVKPAETKRITIGYEAVGAERAEMARLAGSGRDGAVLTAGLDESAARRLSEFLTGDQNIIHIQATAQYSIADPVAYVVRARDVEILLAGAVESELARAVAQSSVDYVRGEGGPQIQNAVLQAAQQMVDRYRLGIAITSVNLDRVLPPPEVVDFFRQANDARNLRDLLIHQAEAEERRLVQQARSKAQETLDQAAAYRDQTIQQARGSSDRFLALLAEYRRAPALTATRLYLEAMERILPRLKGKIIVDSGEGIDVGIMRPNIQ